MTVGLSDEQLEKVRAPLEQAWTLPPKAYTDPAVYKTEETRIFAKSWIPVARVEQVANPGDYMTFTLLDQPLMLVHGHDGEIRVMSRVCLHRAAPIVEGDGNRKLFTCPYHAWGYDTSGHLIAAPLMEGAEGFSPKDCKLPTVRSEIWQGFVLVNLDADAAPFAPQVSGFESYLAGYPMAYTEIVATLDYDSPWNWKVLVENFMEAYHHIATHSTTFEPTYHARDSFVPDNDGPWSILHMPNSAEEVSSHGFPQFEGLRDWQKKDLLATVIFPFFMLAFQSDFVIWYQVWPETHDRFKLKIHLCVHKSAPDHDGFAETVEIIKVGTDFIHQEDIAANDLVWAGLNAPLSKQGRLSTLEKSIWQMNQWWLGQMGLMKG